MPADFTVVAENNNGTNYIREAVLKGETALIVAVKGRSDYYTVQWAERAQGDGKADGKAGGKPAIDEARWLDRLRQLQPIRFCPRVPGESAPFPSCSAKT